MNAWLNATDAAIMLRRPDPLNAVAFPTKFAEYGMVGLPVLMSDAVPEAAAVAREWLSREALHERYWRVYSSAS
ncbi:MAG: hypothetical protein IIA30_00480 [Myxococcales bacterium]|nr:hypothetical protein [Myxococcales bacterium]